VLVPIGKGVPLAGVHVAETGGVPPNTVGAKVTAADTPSSDCAVIGAGHPSDGGAVVGPGGAPLQPAVNTSAARLVASHEQARRESI
jgi:hypothetical protein